MAMAAWLYVTSALCTCPQHDDPGDAIKPKDLSPAGADSRLGEGPRPLCMAWPSSRVFVGQDPGASMRRSVA